MVLVICSLWILQGCVECHNGYFYPKPKYIVTIEPSIEVFSKTIQYEETPVTQGYSQKHYKGHNYAQGHTTTPTKKYDTGHYQGHTAQNIPKSSHVYSSGHYNSSPAHVTSSVHKYRPVQVASSGQKSGHYGSQKSTSGILVHKSVPIYSTGHKSSYNSGHYSPLQSSHNQIASNDKKGYGTYTKKLVFFLNLLI